MPRLCAALREWVAAAHTEVSNGRKRVLDQVTIENWEQVLALIERPAAVVFHGSDVLAYNEAWAHAMASPHGYRDARSVSDVFQNYSNAESLCEALQSETEDEGLARMVLTTGDDSVGEVRREINVEWRKIGVPGADGTLCLIVINDADDEARAHSVDERRVEQLLVNRTVIEEAERIRIGQALHDAVVQELMIVRSSLVDPIDDPKRLRTVLSMLDGVIDEVRTLSFQLSPPILEDLGLLAALHWLVEDIARRYDAVIEVVDNNKEPALSKSAQRIVFRSVRELVSNAMKHAHGSEIVISCVTNGKVMRVVVKDTGPGLDEDALRETLQGARGFGLFSVKHQIQGMGGVFELSSSPGEGVRASIIMPTLATKGTYQ